MENEKTLKDYIAEFSSSWKIGVDSILASAKVYAEAVRHFPTKAEEEFHAAHPSVTQNVWEKLRWIGNGDLNPNAMLVSDVFAKALSRLPIEQQNRIFVGKGFNVVDPKTKVTGFVQFANLTARQERIVFDGEKIRTPDEQKRFIEESLDRSSVSVPYVVEGMRLVVRRKCVIGVNELRKILSEMKR